jgi:hypothetical protein
MRVMSIPGSKAGNRASEMLRKLSRFHILYSRSIPSLLLSLCSSVCTFSNLSLSLPFRKNWFSFCSKDIINSFIVQLFSFAVIAFILSLLSRYSGESLSVYSARGYYDVIALAVPQVAYS